MKKSNILTVTMLTVWCLVAPLKLTAQGVKWDESYSFDRCNVFKMEFYAKGNELMRTMNYKIFYQSGGQNFVVKLVTDKKGNGTETVFDKKNEDAIHITE